MKRTPSDSATAQPLADGVIAAARAGDPIAMETVINHTYPHVQRFLRYLADDPGVADDLTQDVMVNASRHISGLSNDASLMPWLYQMARHAFSSHERRRRRRPTDSLENWMERASGKRDITEPVSAVDQIGDQVCVQEFLNRLSAAEREIVCLRYIADFTAAEIAEMLGISHAAVRQRLHRAVIVMRQPGHVTSTRTRTVHEQRRAADGTA